MLNYFGTTLDSAGHYFFELEGSSIYRSRISFNECPFNPESLPYKKKGEVFKKGASRFCQFAGFSIYAIEGSCADTRGATKSIFFIEDEVSKDDLKSLILSTPIAKKIIDKMPFEVEW